MFYHYNTITNEENPVLCESLKKDGDGDIHSWPVYILHSNRMHCELSFSERFEQIRRCDKTICQIVFPRKSTIRLFMLILFFIGFLYFGAWTFQILEHQNEMKNRDKFKEARRTFLQEHPCVSDSALEEFIKQIENLKDMGLSAHANASEVNWNIPTGVFFATTLVTTIGYGNDKPLTNWGKIFCIVFIIIGLPLMMILATAVIERMLVFIDLTCSALCYRRKWSITEDKFREIEIIVCIIILLVGFIFIPAWAFSALEENRWSYLEAIYYCIISLTTIGLGDFVPGESSNTTHRNRSKIISTIYLFVGLLWASFCIQIFHRYHRWNIGAKFIYLECDDLNFQHDRFTNDSPPQFLRSPQEPDGDGSCTNLEQLEHICLKNTPKFMTKSY